MAEKKEFVAKRLEIKKYANRRYYDSHHSRHLTLEEIRGLVQQGYDLHVSDAKTGADITAQLLTQIILELETPKLDSLPVPLLVRLIRMNDQLVKDFIEKYFNQALKSFFDYQQTLEAHMRKSHGLPSNLPTMAEWTKAMMSPFSAAFGATTESKEYGAPTAPAGSSEDLLELINELKGEVEQLKSESSKKARKAKN